MFTRTQSSSVSARTSKDARRIGGIEIFAETGTWENLQELRWVLKDIAGMEPARKTIDLEGRLINDGVWNAIRDRQNALHELVHAIHEYRKLSESKPLTLQGIRLCTRGFWN